MLIPEITRGKFQIEYNISKKYNTIQTDSGRSSPYTQSLTRLYHSKPSERKSKTPRAKVVINANRFLQRVGSYRDSRQGSTGPKRSRTVLNSQNPSPRQNLTPIDKLQDHIASKLKQLRQQRPGQPYTLYEYVNAYVQPVLSARIQTGQNTANSSGLLFEPTPSSQHAVISVTSASAQMQANYDVTHMGQGANSNFSSLMYKQINQKYSIKGRGSNQGEQVSKSAEGKQVLQRETNLKVASSSGYVTATTQQSYYRGSYPQQKHKIKAIKRIHDDKSESSLVINRSEGLALHGSHHVLNTDHSMQLPSSNLSTVGQLPVAAISRNKTSKQNSSNFNQPENVSSSVNATGSSNLTFMENKRSLASNNRIANATKLANLHPNSSSVLSNSQIFNRTTSSKHNGSIPLPSKNGEKDFVLNQSTNSVTSIRSSNQYQHLQKQEEEKQSKNFYPKLNVAPEAINFSQNQFLLPNHQVRANGPNTLTAFQYSKPLLSSSLEKVNLKGDSGQNMLFRHYETQKYLNSGQYNNMKTGNYPNNITSLKVKKAPGAKSRAFMTPKRSQKGKEVYIQIYRQEQPVPQNGVLVQSKQQTKANQYLHKSFMIKQSGQGYLTRSSYKGRLNGQVSKTSASVSPRNSVKKAAILRTVAGGYNKGLNGQNEQVSQWANSKMLVNNSGLSISQNSGKNSNNATYLTSNNQDKLLIDKKTYNDLMNYLIKVECNRIKGEYSQYTHYSSSKNQVEKSGITMGSSNHKYASYADKKIIVSNFIRASNAMKDQHDKSEGQISAILKNANINPESGAIQVPIKAIKTTTSGNIKKINTSQQNQSHIVLKREGNTGLNLQVKSSKASNYAQQASHSIEQIGKSRNGPLQLKTSQTTMGTKGPIPAKVIKVRSLIRTTGQQPQNGSKPPYKAYEEAKAANAQAYIIAMKNNFMIHHANDPHFYNGSDEKRYQSIKKINVIPSQGLKRDQANSSKKYSGKNLKLKELKLYPAPYNKEPRVYSAKSSYSVRYQQAKLGGGNLRSSAQGPVPKVKMSIPLPSTSGLNNLLPVSSGAYSHRESQRYFSKQAENCSENMRDDKLNAADYKGGSRKGSNANSRSKPAVNKGKPPGRASSSSKEKSSKTRLPIQRTFPTEPDVQQYTMISGEQGAIPLEMLVGPADIEEYQTPGHYAKDQDQDELTGKNFNTFGEQAPNLFSQTNQLSKNDITKQSYKNDRNVYEPSNGKTKPKKVKSSSKGARMAENMSASNDSKEREKFASIQSPTERYNTQQFHYSGSFGIPDSPLSSDGEAHVSCDVIDDSVQSNKNIQHNLMMTAQSTEYQDKTSKDKYRQSSAKQEKFKLVNMSFSYDGTDIEHKNHGKKYDKNLIQSYQKFESLEDGTANDKHIKKEIKKKIQTDPDYRKQLLLRVLPKFEKLDQLGKIYQESAHTHTQQKDGKVSTSAAHLIRYINQSLGKSDSIPQGTKENVSKTVTPKQSMAQDASIEGTQSSGEYSYDAGEQVETYTVVENECENDFQYMMDTPKTPNSIYLVPYLSQSEASGGRIMTSPVSSEAKSPINLSSAKYQKHVLNLALLPSEVKTDESLGNSALANAVYSDLQRERDPHSGLASMRHSKKDFEFGQKNLVEVPETGFEHVAKTIEQEDSSDNLDSTGALNYSLVENESISSYDDEQLAFGLLDGCDKPILDMITSVVQPYHTEVHEDYTDKIDELKSDKSNSFLYQEASDGNSGENIVGEDDQFGFVENLNQQYEDAMQYRKFMKMLNRPRQNSL